MNNNLFNDILIGENYYSIEDLRYNNKLNYNFSKEQINQFIEYKESLLDNGGMINNFIKLKNIPLSTFNSKFCFYTEGKYLLSLYSEYLSVFVKDYYGSKKDLISRNFKDILFSRVFSEVEGTLRIENVPTTRTRIKKIYNSDNLQDKNDIIIKNMLNSIMFIMEEKPAFNKENLRKLYGMLSDGCLDSENILQEDMYYRNDSVYIAGFEGADYNLIDQLMDSLFEFANDRKNINEYSLLLPHICHYYILYVHPYFDYNGRTARMVSFWLNYIYDITGAPLFISEAINEDKNGYYNALTNTRIMKNDLTYFLGYILENAIKFSYIYKNIEQINKILSKEGNFLTTSELFYIKKILIHKPNDYFNLKMFFEYIGSNMSRQGGLKTLNNLTHYGILIKEKNKKDEVIFKVNQEFILYNYKSN